MPTRHFIVQPGQGLHDPQPLNGFTTRGAAEMYRAVWTLIPADGYEVIELPEHTGHIAAFVREGNEDTARGLYGDAAVDEYFERVEGVDAFAARVDIDELARRLEAIGDDVTALAHSVGLPVPGAAKTEDLVREMWAKVHAAHAALPPAVNETRALGLAG